VKAEDFDPVDEQQVEIYDGHPVELVVSVVLGDEESQLLTELVEAEGADPPATRRAALRRYAAARSQRTSWFRYRPARATRCPDRLSPRSRLPLAPCRSPAPE